MVKLQLLRHQIDSLQLSQEDSDNFYLQQISETRRSESTKELSIVQQSLVVPLLSSRSSSPMSQPDTAADHEEE